MNFRLAALCVSITVMVGCGPTLPSEDPLDSLSQGVCHAQQLCPNGTWLTCSSPGSTCTADQDADGLFVRCGTEKTYCPPGPSPDVCTASFPCESGPYLTCTGYACQVLGPLDSKVCGGVQCDGVPQYCPPLPGDLECY